MNDQSRPEIRICVVGDEIVAGAGDARAMGWVGRVAARTPHVSPRVTVFNLGVPGESTQAMAGRWLREVSPRFDDALDNRLVVGLGTADLARDVSLSRSRLHLADVLDEALSLGLKVLVVGPTPQLDAGVNQRVAELSDAWADVVTRRHVPFVDTVHPLADHEQWRTDLAQSDGRLPGQAGYGLIAWLVLHRGWFPWLGLAPLD